MSKILVIEDNPGDILLIREVIRMASQHEVEVLSDGDTVMSRLKDSSLDRPDLIFIDYDIPKISGARLLKLIKEDETLSDIPVVFWADLDQKNFKKYYELGANTVQLKPMLYEAFQSILASNLNFWLDISESPNQEIGQNQVLETALTTGQRGE